jgi:hypothetical protein
MISCLKNKKITHTHNFKQELKSYFRKTICILYKIFTGSIVVAVCIGNWGK